MVSQIKIGKGEFVMAGYQKNTWELYNESIPVKDQPNAFITKRKLDNIESGIENAITDFQIGTVTKGADACCEIVADENDPSIKKINMVIPKEVSWLFSDVELHDGDIAPTGVAINDIILDSKGNIFNLTLNSNNNLILNKKLNITGNQGKAGLSTYDLWLSLGNTGNAEDFFYALKGDPGDTVNVIDSLESTSETEALSANQGRILKNNRLTTLEDVLANEEEGIFVDALVVKELYLKLIEMINK